eukprot:scaffold2858_cov109-Cylindrotheca_fusiformis.AAC.6
MVERKSRVVLVNESKKIMEEDESKTSKLKMKKKPKRRPWPSFFSNNGNNSSSLIEISLRIQRPKESLGGVSLVQTSQGVVRIGAIEDGSEFANSPLQVGMKI